MYCPQQTREVPDTLTEFLSAPDGSAARLADRLAIGYDWPYRWDTLSPVEQKRAQLAAVVWLAPDLLIVDEPTNHLDGVNRRWVEETLLGYNGIGLVISHDRAA